MVGSSLAWSLMLCSWWVAADPDLKKGVTDPSQADADFAIQGEYSGSACLWGCRQQMGLQVVALGDGRFDALLYPGGLPGNGYNGGVKSKLSGQREGDRVILQGERVSATLQTGFAVILTDRAGQLLGYLQPMHRYSLTAGAPPPPGAVVLFDGRPSNRLKNATISENGLLQVGAETVDAYRDFILHAEFKTPYMPYARGQARGNSGFYLQQRYEVQVLDSFGLESQNNDAGGLYKFKAPDLNMCFPPLSWQTYDIHFQAARFDDAGTKVENARITVWHNGVVIHNQVSLENKTGGGKPEAAQPLPILFQNHGNPVEFRNVWLVDRSATPATCVPQPSCCGR
uniref:DUF1080 domain-containing protein n=1 Tax=Schlesneria paludicola TaxID=360056 RepID=A0A7C2K070_9PLAN